MQQLTFVNEIDALVYKYDLEERGIEAKIIKTTDGYRVVAAN